MCSSDLTSTTTSAFPCCSNIITDVTFLKTNNSEVSLVAATICRQFLGATRNIEPIS